MAGLDFSHRAVAPQASGAPDFASRATTQPISVAEDIARSLPTGLAEGGAGFVGQLGDIQNLGQAAYNKVAQYAQQHGFNMPSAQQMPQVLPPGAGAYLQAAAGAVAHRLHVDPALARAAVGAMIPAAGIGGPGSGEVLNAATGGHPLYQPQTKPGQYGRTIAAFAPAAALPTSARTIVGQVARRALNAAAPGAASELAGQQTAGTPYEPYARAAGGIAAGALTTALTQPRPSTKMLAAATEGATDDQIGQAAQLMRDAQQRETQLTTAEAIQQVTGNGTGMGRLQRVIEGTKAGERRFGPVMAARPDQLRRAVLGYADTVAPPTANPSAIGPQAQAAAQGGLDDIRQSINADAQPHYDALRGEQFGPVFGATVRSQVPYARALSQIRNNAELNSPISGLPDDNLSVVNEVVKQLDRNIEASRQTQLNPGGNNQLAGLRTAARTRADILASLISDNWRNARNTVAQGRADRLDPVQAGPVGTIAGTQDVPAQTSALFPSQPLEGAPNETAQAIRLLAGQDPTAGPALVRQHLVNALNEATQNLQSGPNQWGGAKYAAVIAGNPEQRANLLSGADAAGANADDLSNLLDVLDATGKRQAQGSKTAFNTSDLQNLGAMGTLGHVVDTAVDPMGFFDKLGHGWEKYQAGRNAGQIADALLAQPDDVAAALLRARQLAPQNLGIVPSMEYLLLGSPNGTGAAGAP